MSSMTFGKLPAGFVNGSNTSSLKVLISVSHTEATTCDDVIKHSARLLFVGV